MSQPSPHPGRSEWSLTDSEPDAIRVRRIQRFEPEALNQLFDRVFESIHGLAWALLGDPAQVEEVAGRSFLAVLDELRSLRFPGPTPDQLCLEMAAGLAVEALKSAPGGGGIDVPTGGVPGTDRVRAALATLSSDRAELVVLRLLGGLDASELAVVTGRRFGSVLSSQAQALEALAGALFGPAPVVAVLGRHEVQLLEESLARVVAAGSNGRDVTGSGIEPLTRAAAAVRSLPARPPDPGVRSRTREVLLEEAARRRVAWVHSHALPHHSRPVRRPGSGKRALGMVAIGVIALCFGSAMAGMAELSEPDSPLYPLKQLGESVLITISTDPTARADLEVKLADERLREAEAMAAARRGDLVVEMIGDHYDLLTSAAVDLGSTGSTRSPRWLSVRDRLVQQESQSVQGVQQQLLAYKDQSDSDQVERLSLNFEADRKRLDPPLVTTTRTPQPGPTVSPTPPQS